MKDLSKDQIKAIAAQLRCPDGEHGISMGEIMQETNVNMILSCIKEANIKTNDQLLELGPGNAHHLPKLFKIAKNISYTGLDISNTMLEEAAVYNKELITKGKVHFKIYNGLEIPFSDANFNTVFTVNTIYFWQEPIKLLQEIYRVLKTGGNCCICYAQKDFMKDLPFTAYGFTLYNKDSILSLVKHTKFNIADIKHFSEKVKSKTGELVERKYTVVNLIK